MKKVILTFDVYTNILQLTNNQVFVDFYRNRTICRTFNIF
jgi:hypothetical protein